jgi:hypothetical protein
MGHDLPSIKSAGQNQAIVAALSAGVTGELSIHIGANDMAQEGRFEWSDGSAWGYTNWYPYYQQPDDGGGAEDCAELYLGSTAVKGMFHTAVGYWNDEPCSGYTAPHVVCAARSGELTLALSKLARGFGQGLVSGRRRFHVCHVQLTHLAGAVTAAPAANKTFLADGRAHYYYSTPMSWNAARAFCLNMGLDLPSIKSAAQNQAIVAALSAGLTGELSIHIGASDSAQEGQSVRWLRSTCHLRCRHRHCCSR